LIIIINYTDSDYYYQLRFGGDILKRMCVVPLLLFLFLFGISPVVGASANDGTDNVIKAEKWVDQAMQTAEQGKLSDSKDYYDEFNEQWLDFEDTVKVDSGKAYKDIESNMGQVEFAFMQNKQNEVVLALKQLKETNQRFVNGQYTKGESFKQENITLSDFITLLQQTKEKAQAHDRRSALESITKVRESWLSVEGNVVAQSASVYSDSERDMVVVNAMIADGKDQEAVQLLDEMIEYLTPLSTKSGYTMWDAAMIPIREGLEALLVVGALLAFAKKSNHRKAKSWIWAGVSTGLIISAILAVIVKVIFSSGAFGQNNFLIAGWTGIFAAGMLLYMSYWLHSKANIKEWSQYIYSKSQTALGTGKMISLGILSFLAVFREGTETVLFFIGMANQISLQNLIVGILIGFTVLAVLAYLMLFIGLKLPVRPFFLVSSLLVYYLCFKFTGLGIHSLQLANALPSTTSKHLPSIEFLGFYPSWQSSIPQLLLIVFATAVLIWKQFNLKRQQLQNTIQN
jgi:high-affinity iron transporter